MLALGIKFKSFDDLIYFYCSTNSNTEPLDSMGLGETTNMNSNINLSLYDALVLFFHNTLDTRKGIIIGALSRTF